MEDSKEHALEELTEYYEKKLQEKTSQLEQVSSVFHSLWLHQPGTRAMLQYTRHAVSCTTHSEAVSKNQRILTRDYGRIT